MCLDVPAALHELSDVSNRIAELIEWMKLAEQEDQSPFPSAVRPADDLEGDLRAMYGWFVSLSARIQDALIPTNVTGQNDQRDGWFRRLTVLHRRVDSSGVRRWISP